MKQTNLRDFNTIRGIGMFANFVRYDVLIALWLCKKKKNLLLDRPTHTHMYMYMLRYLLVNDMLSALKLSRKKRKCCQERINKVGKMFIITGTG